MIRSRIWKNRCRSPVRVHSLAILTGVLAGGMTLTGCDRKQAASSTPPPPPAATGTQAAAEGGWSAVRASPMGNGILAYKNIARRCDGWHKGEKARITLRHDFHGAIADDAGNSMSMSPEDWKSIIGLARGPKGPQVAVAAKSEFYAGNTAHSDAFGVIARHKYTIEVLDDSSVVFRNDGKYDDGK